MEHANTSRGSGSLELVGLAWPILLSQVAVMGGSVLDTSMAGHLGAVDLAAIGIGASVYITIYMFFMGVTLSLSPIVSQLYGQARHDRIAHYAVQGTWLCVGLGGAGAGALLLSRRALTLTGADADVVAVASGYLTGMAWALPPLLIYRVFYALRTAVGTPWTPTLLSLVALALKFPLNAIFMRGIPGLVPALGGVGCAVASAILNWGLGLIAIICLWRQLALERPEPRLSTIGELLRLGVPIGLMQLIEVASFAGMAMFVARLGAETSAAHQIVANLATTLFMLPLSLSLATSILTARALGAADPDQERAVVRSGLRLVLGCAALTAGALLFGRWIIGLYTSDAHVVLLASSVLVWVGLAQFGDSVQVYYAAVLRAYRKTVPPVVVSCVCRWGLGLMGGVYLALGPPGYGLHGFWIGSAAALTCSGAILAWWARHQARARRRSVAGSVQVATAS